MDAQAWDEKYRGRDVAAGAPPNGAVVEFATSLPPGRALDLACGEGRNAVWLASRGWRVDAVDFSAVALTAAVRVASGATASIRERLQWVHADVTDLTLEPQYDLVLLSYLHLSPPERAALLARIHTALKHEGILVIVGHHRDNVEHGVGGPQDVEILYSAEDLVSELSDELAVETAETRPRVVDDAVALDALVVARLPAGRPTVGTA